METNVMVILFTEKNKLASLKTSETMSPTRR